MPKQNDLDKEMIGGCCVCSDDRGWTENPLVYCDGEGCNVAVHQGELSRIYIISYINYYIYIYMYVLMFFPVHSTPCREVTCS